MVNEKCQCAVCGGEYNKSYETRHLASKKQIKATGGGLTVESKKTELEPIEEDDEESDDDTDIASDDTIVDETDNDDDSFLGDLEADKGLT